VPVIADATNYEWSLEPAAAGTMNILANENTVTWSESWSGAAILKVRGTNDCGTGAWSANYEVLVQNCTGISDVDLSKAFTVYPNPGDGNFTLTVNQDFNTSTEISIINFFGTKVYSKTTGQISSGTNISFNLTDQPEGIYYLKIEGESGSFVKKILIHQ
jgi:hypothetical protein